MIRTGFGLAGLNAVVAGADGDIGRAVAVALGEQGCNVALLGRPEYDTEVAVLSNEISAKYSVRSFAVTVDFESISTLNEAAAGVVSSFGGAVDCLVNNVVVEDSDARHAAQWVAGLYGLLEPAARRIDDDEVAGAATEIVEPAHHRRRHAGGEAFLQLVVGQAVDLDTAALLDGSPLIRRQLDGHLRVIGHTAPPLGRAPLRPACVETTGYQQARSETEQIRCHLLRVPGVLVGIPM